MEQAAGQKRVLAAVLPVVFQVETVSSRHHYSC